MPLEPILKRETLPPGFDPLKLDWDVRQKVKSDKLVDWARLFALYGNEKGAFGNRAGNPWRVSRRRWIERFVRVKQKNGKIVPLVLNHVQRRLEAEILRMERKGVPVRVILLKARQMGCSTYIAAVAYEHAIRNAKARGCLITQKSDISEAIHDRLCLMLTEMQKESGEPWELKPKRRAAGLLVMHDPIGSELLTESAEVDEPLRGDTFQVLHISEAPIWPDADRKADAVAQTLPDEPGTYGFNEATANGDFGWFPREFKRAWSENRMGRAVRYGWRGFFAPWYWDQTYRWSYMTGSPPDSELAGDISSTLSEEEKTLLGQRYIVRGKGWVKVDLDQLAWRRHTIKNKCRNSIDAFHQEYPATPSEAFLSSGMPFFEPTTIARHRELAVRAPEFIGELVDEEAEALLALRPVIVEVAEKNDDSLRPAG